MGNPLPNQHNSFQNDRKTQLHPQALDTWLLWVVSNYLKERRRCSYYPRHPYTTCEGLQGRIQGYRAGLPCVRLIEEGHREVQNRPSTRRRYLLWQCLRWQAAYKVRAAALAAGFPNTTAASTVNRFCSSGLKATQDIANQIASGNIDIGVAMGAEMMSVGG